MNSTDYKTTLQTKIEECPPKIDYYKSYTDTVMSAYWKGRKEAHEEDLKLFEEIEPEKKIRSK